MQTVEDKNRRQENDLHSDVFFLFSIRRRCLKLKISDAGQNGLFTKDTH